jgi:hypothetical protein
MPESGTTKQEWAKLGAKVRLQELDQERSQILAAFPEFSRGRRPAAVESGSRPRRRFSAAARRRMAAGMRKYWAKRRALKKEQ